jgi:hypothetical protein
MLTERYKPKPIEPDVVWAPIPGTSQELAIDSRCNELLFTGTRGPGKTECQLMKFRRRVGIGYGMYWRGVIFDREYKHLDDLVNKSKRLFSKFMDGGEFLEALSSYKWVWPTGEELLFRVFDKKTDYDKYHGQEYPYQGWNELTKYPHLLFYNMMISCCRSSFQWEKDGPIVDGKHQYVPPIPLEIFSTCNSIGPGHACVKAKFIDPAPYGQVVKTKSIVFDPKTKEDVEVTRTQVAIFGSYKENIYLDPIYIAGLYDTNDPALKRAWTTGDWDVISGGAFDDLWKGSVHIIPRFQIPEGWYVDRSFDWGSSQPFSVGWWAEANGEEVEIKVGKETVRFAPAAGSLIQIAEWYGTRQMSTNRGLRLGSSAIAKEIKQREIKLYSDSWIPELPSAGPADNQIRNVTDEDNDTIEKKMQDEGIYWTESDKSPGSRKIGFELARERLRAAITHEGPAIYVMNNCIASIQIIPVLPRDPEKEDDVDTEAEDHPWDMWRFRILKGNNRYATNIPCRTVN